jgi:hypothetical protein
MITQENYNVIDKQVKNKINNKKILKTNIINIDSNNRQKYTKLVTEPISGSISTNGLTVLDNHRIKVYHPNHGMQPSDTTIQIILTDVEGDFKNNKYLSTIGGIPLKYINYNSTTGFPIHSVKILPTLVGDVIQKDASTGLIKSDYYIITIKNDILKSNIVTDSTGGGSNMSAVKITDTQQGYKYASKFKISLGGIYKNIISARLISIELSNTQLAIQNQKPILETDDNLVNKSDFNSANDTIYWINKDDKVRKYNVSLISDNRMNNKIILKNNSDTLTTAQTTQGELLSTFLTDNSPNVYIPVSLYNDHTYWPENYFRYGNNVFFGYIKTTFLALLSTQLLNEKTLILAGMTDKSIPLTSTNPFLNSLNAVTDITGLLTFITDNIVTSPVTLNTTIVDAILDGPGGTSISSLGDKTIMRMMHKYLNMTRDLYSKYDYYNTTTSINTYGCFWEILEVINNSNYYIDSTVKTLGKIKLTPMINNTADTHKIIPSRPSNSVNEYTIYPIYKILINQGTYTSKSFVTETENKFNEVQTIDYNFNTNSFENKVLLNKLSIKIKDQYHNFKVTLDDDNNKFKINQYKDIFSYTASDKLNDDEQGPFVINDQYTNIFINHKGHSLKTGDVIYIEGSSRLSNIPANEINREHVVKVYPVYKCYIRLMLGVPDTTLLQNSGNMDNTTSTGEYYFHYGLKPVDYGTYKSGNALNYMGSQLTANTVNVFKKNELILKIDELTKKQIVLGRIATIAVADANGNLEISYSLLSDTNFQIGDIIVSSETISTGMIVPRTYGSDISSGSHEIGLPNESELSGLTSDITLIPNGSPGYSIQSTTVPNKTSLDGVGGTNVNIRIPVSFSLLFNKDYTPYKVLGFNKEDTEFNTEHSNTEKINTAFIEYSYLENNTSNIINNRKLQIKTKSNTNFIIGSKIYISDHTLNNKIVDEKPTIEIQVDSYEPFSAWMEKFTVKQQTDINTWLDTNISNFYQAGTGDDNTIVPSIYFGTRTVIYYTVPYTNNQKQDLGNLGNTVNQFDDIDYYDYNLESNLRNIYGIKKDSYVYIHKNSKATRDLLDVGGDGITSGIPDGYYKVLENLNLDLVSSFYPHLNKSINAIVIDYEFTDSTTRKISWGYINRGYIRAPSFNTEIVGKDKTHTTVSSTFSIAKTAGTKLITIPRADATKFSKGFIIILNGLYIDNSTQYLDNKYSRTGITTMESNIVDDVYDDTDDDYSIIRCTYDLLNAHSAGETIYKYNFITNLSESATAGVSVIKVAETTETTTNITAGKVVKIDWNKQVSSMTTAQKQFYIEDVNYITSVASVSGNIEITLKYSIINTHASGVNLVVFPASIEDNCISTQLVYIDDNWYTRLFYNGIRSIYDRQYFSGKVVPSTSNNVVGYPYVNPFLTANVYIDDNNGYYIPHSNLTSSNTLDTSIDIITPIPPDRYDTYTYNDEDTIYKNTNASIPINGIFINDVWNNDADITGYDYYFNFNSITIPGKYNGFSGTITRFCDLKENYINHHSGFIINDIKKIVDGTSTYDILKLNLSSKDLNIVPPANMITPLLKLTAIESRPYKIGYGGTIYQRQILNTVNVEGEKYIYMSIKHLDNIITNEFTTSDSAFAKILLNSKIGNDVFNSFINTKKDFTNGLLPELDEIEVTFFNDNGKLYDFNNENVSFTLELITEEEILETININPNNLF